MEGEERKTARPAVQVFGRKVRVVVIATSYVSNYTMTQKTATAVAHCKQGNGLIKVNGKPLHLVQPATLRYKVSLY